MASECRAITMIFSNALFPQKTELGVPFAHIDFQA
jgi:hypothetical protein